MRVGDFIVPEDLLSRLNVFLSERSEFARGDAEEWLLLNMPKTFGPDGEERRAFARDLARRRLLYLSKREQIRKCGPGAWQWNPR